MSEKGSTEGKERLQLDRIVATGAALTGSTDDDATCDHQTEEQKEKQGRAGVWGSGEAMVVKDGTQNRGTVGAMLADLPDECISLIVSYLSPKDVARAACVCQEFRKTLDLDPVWEQLVPRSISKLEGLSDELKAATKKELFTLLCKPYLLRNTQAYWLDQDTGGVSYSVAARGLRVVWGDDERYWGWSPRPGARWTEVACLYDVCWFHMSGNIKCRFPRGAYTLSWRIQFETRSQESNYVSGWDRLPVEFSVSTADRSQITTSRRYLTNRPGYAAELELDDLTPVRLVEDSWLEFDAGEIIVVDEENVTSLDFSMVETDSGAWKSGIILDGVTLRPTSLARKTGRYLNMEEFGESSLENGAPHIQSHQVHPVGLRAPTRRLGGQGPIGGIIPRRRGGIRHVQPDPAQLDAGEN